MIIFRNDALDRLGVQSRARSDVAGRGGIAQRSGRTARHRTAAPHPGVAESEHCLHDACGPRQKELDPERLALALEKAKKNAASGERLYKSGIIAKVDAENRVLKAIRLESDLAEAKLALARQNLEVQQVRLDAGEISSEELETAKSVLAAAAKDAESATAKKDRAELDAAELNLRRQQKLLAMGSGRKSEVSRAQEKLSTLQQKN